MILETKYNCSHKEEQRIKRATIVVPISNSNHFSLWGGGGGERLGFPNRTISLVLVSQEEEEALLIHL